MTVRVLNDGRNDYSVCRSRGRTARANLFSAADRAAPFEKRHTILVVDDEPLIRQLFADFFSCEGYTVQLAADGIEALACIAERAPDLVISDICMPKMNGIDLFNMIGLQYPRIKRILMTSNNIDDYLSLVRRYNIGNVLVKEPAIDLREIGNYVKSIVTGAVFGLDRYFPHSECSRAVIDCYARSEEVSEHISRKCPGDGRFLQMAIDELIANAVFHGVLQCTGIPREWWRGDSDIAGPNAVSVTWADDTEKIGVAVEDPRGNLKKVDALRWLDQRDACGREKEEHGRGLYLVRKLIDRFIINIDPGKRTECIIINYFNKNHRNHHKPIMIHEL